jgi:hypothetical protein
MPHRLIQVLDVRRAQRLIVAALALLSAAQAAHVAFAGPIFSVGDREVIYTASQRRNLGLNFWPDGSMGVVAGNNGQLQFYAANSSSSVRTTGTLTSPAQSKQNVSIIGASGYNYVAGGPIYQDPTTGTRLMVYHGETHYGSAQNYYTTLGLAVARDSSGLIFDDLGTIIRSNIAGPYHHSIDLGGGSLTAFDGNLYIHYRDYLADGTSSQLSVARAPISTVISNALSRQSTEFTKYFNGGWTESGVGGRATPLEAGNPFNNL